MLEAVVETEADAQKEDHDDFHSTSGNLMDTRTSHLDDELKQKLEEALDEASDSVRLHEISKITTEHSPIDIS